MNLRTQTSLFCGALALAIAVSMLLRGGPRRSQLFFAAFAGDIGLWYLAQWLYQLHPHAIVWARFTASLAVLLPQFAVHLFDAILPSQSSKPGVVRAAHLLLVPMAVLVASPDHEHGLVRGAIFLYVFGLLAAGLVSLWRRGEKSGSRAIQRRVRFLVLTGALAAVFALADFLWYIDAPLPPVGAVLAVVFLFVLAETLSRDRLVDAYEMAAMALVSTALAFILAGIFYVAVVFSSFQTMYLNAVLGAIVVLVLFEPLRDKVGAYIHKAFFTERADLERAVLGARSELAGVLELKEMAQIVMSALEGSRRATGAALYLRDPAGGAFRLVGGFGPAAPQRLEGAPARPLLERLRDEPFVLLESVARDGPGRRRAGASVELTEPIVAAAELLGPYRKAACLRVRAEASGSLGILLVIDDRVIDAFSLEDVVLLESLAVQIAVVVENSRQYLRLRDRDRLATLGQLAAGLAHEVKNPLGAIKGAAQLLTDPIHGGAADPASSEFLGIILEEVDRLNRVVGSVLDYARPAKGNPRSIDVNAVVTRTLQVLASSRDEDARYETDLAQDLPAVRADDEQLRQVLINLVRNAVQAAGSTGTVRVTTRDRRAEGGGWGRAGASPRSVEISVSDDGPGIPPEVLPNLFVPFFTTKDRGTGLGLAISQRVVEEMGGRIEVASQVGSGATFTVVLPAASDAATPRPAGVAASEAEAFPSP